MPLKPANDEPTIRQRYEACMMDGKTAKEAAEYLDVTLQAAVMAYWRLSK